MTKLAWDAVGERRFETGVDQGVLYLPTNGVYAEAYAWNGLTTVTESPSGAESTPQYADNIKYLNLVSAEDFSATLEAFTYPDAFLQCDGSVAPAVGVTIGQQSRRQFGLSYRTRVGNDVSGDAFGYKLHLLYGCLAAPSEKAFATVNDSPEALAFSWQISTSPVAVSGYKPTALLTIDSTKVGASYMQALTDALYGTVGADGRLPLPDEIVAMFAGAAPTSVNPTAPVFTSATHSYVVPTTTGVVYRRSDTNAVVTGTVTMTVGQSYLVKAQPAPGYVFPSSADTDWNYTY